MASHLGVLIDGNLRFQDNQIINGLDKFGGSRLVYVADPERFDNVNYLGFLETTLLELNVEFLRDEQSLEKYIKKHGITTIHMSILADKRLKNKSVERILYSDEFLVDPRELRTMSGTPYRVFGAFAKKVAGMVSEPDNKRLRPRPRHIHKLTRFPKYIRNPEQKVKGGRVEGLKLLDLATRRDDYEINRNIPHIDTTLLSAHHMFGTISVRESYDRLKTSKCPTLPNQLLWREFYLHILYHFPETKDTEMREDRRKLKGWWKNDTSEEFTKWKTARTGVPIVDAGMTQLSRTGWMHNRVRMIVSQYLTKNLHVDWRCGESWFAKNLIDYDVAQNVGNWQWNAGVGTDPEPFGVPRVFNPTRQQKMYDPDNIYIHRWLGTEPNVETTDLTIKITKDTFLKKVRLLRK